MKGNKRVDVKGLVEFANESLSMPEDDFITYKFKEGIISMLEKVLHRSGNYDGFYFINADDCEVRTFGHVSRVYFFKP